MKRSGLEEAIERIRRMEQCFDLLEQAVQTGSTGEPENTFFRSLVGSLSKYYEGGLWRHDYELDEKGLLPPDLKRGVLAQDAVYDLLEQLDCRQQQERRMPEEKNSAEK